jgi:hypothetical protein
VVFVHPEDLVVTKRDDLSVRADKRVTGLLVANKALDLSARDTIVETEILRNGNAFGDVRNRL